MAILLRMMPVKISVTSKTTQNASNGVVVSTTSFLQTRIHCELNFIEFFWGAVKQYLRENCDYSFKTLQENMPKALESVKLSTIRKWEHRMIRWMEAYRSGLGAKAAQFQVREFGTKQYKSHRCVPETVACQFDVKYHIW
jgi:hypothetical protein